MNPGSCFGWIPYTTDIIESSWGLSYTYKKTILIDNGQIKIYFIKSRDSENIACSASPTQSAGKKWTRMTVGFKQSRKLARPNGKLGVSNPMLKYHQKLCSVN